MHAWSPAQARSSSSLSGHLGKAATRNDHACQPAGAVIQSRSLAAIHPRSCPTSGLSPGCQKRPSAHGAMVAGSAKVVTFQRIISAGGFKLSVWCMRSASKHRLCKPRSGPVWKKWASLRSGRRMLSISKLAFLVSKQVRRKTGNKPFVSL